MSESISSHRDLRVYKQALDLMLVTEGHTQQFPKDERFRSIDQILRSSSSVCANLGEAWRRRRYKASFIHKLNECEAEAGETQVWLEIAMRRGYIEESVAEELIEAYEQVIRQLATMILNSNRWTLPQRGK